MDNIENIDIGEFAKQYKNEIRQSEGSVTFELVAPPISLDSVFEGKPIVPQISCKSNGATNYMTVAFMLTSLQNFINDELKDPMISRAYKLAKEIVDHTEKIKVDLDEENDDE